MRSQHENSRLARPSHMTEIDGLRLVQLLNAGHAWRWRSVRGEVDASKRISRSPIQSSLNKQNRFHSGSFSSLQTVSESPIQCRVWHRPRIVRRIEFVHPWLLPLSKSDDWWQMMVQPGG
jgi:hypothetical protein